ncbi:hypothetical protein EHV15_28370 [Paenibacillus oralis]|uniref:Uncharacterized protein n=1 Tax=Paenibacillus oralis TaxID=2490856 RepID=A0A3P3U822_9BACL|nr:hypothetical protein [Paenibacillus oralis]RRJ66400.1 hypothetical protein EHV15_28370 [Paenibacillus oralis]
MLKFYIHELDYAISFLYKLELTDYSSRMRTRFLKILVEREHQFRDEYYELIKEHCRLDEQDNPIVIYEGDYQRYDIKDLNVFNAALLPLLNEEFYIELTMDKKNMIQSVAQSVLNCGLAFTGDEQFKYETLAEKFENLGFETQE